MGSVTRCGPEGLPQSGRGHSGGHRSPRRGWPQRRDDRRHRRPLRHGQVERIERQQDEVVRSLIKRAGDEGLSSADIDVAEAMTHLLDPLLLFAHSTESVALDEGIADRTVERFLAAYGPDRVAAGVQ